MGQMRQLSLRFSYMFPIFLSRFLTIRNAFIKRTNLVMENSPQRTFFHTTKKMEPIRTVWENCAAMVRVRREEKLCHQNGYGSRLCYSSQPFNLFFMHHISPKTGVNTWANIGGFCSNLLNWSFVFSPFLPWEWSGYPREQWIIGICSFSRFRSVNKLGFHSGIWILGKQKRDFGANHRINDPRHLDANLEMYMWGKNWHIKQEKQRGARKEAPH